MNKMKASERETLRREEEREHKDGQGAGEENMEMKGRKKNRRRWKINCKWREEQRTRIKLVRRDRGILRTQRKMREKMKVGRFALKD